MNHEGGKILGAFLIGGILGIGLALLFAPQSGKKTRKNISKFASKVKDDAREVAENAAESVEDLAVKVAEKISDVVSTGEGLSEDAKKKTLKAIEDAQKIIGKQKAKLSKLIK